MESVSIACASLDGLRLDFPSKFDLFTLPYLWDDEKNHQICFVDKQSWIHAKKRDEFGSMIASADMILPHDSSLAERVLMHGVKSLRCWSVPFIHQLLLDAIKESMAEENSAGLDNTEEETKTYRPQKVLTLLLSSLEKRNGSMFLLGGNPITLIKAEKNIRATYPGITIVGSMQGLYRSEEEPAIIEAIQKGAPQLILAGSPLPGEECWIPRHMNVTRSGIFFYYKPIMKWISGK
jgi:exopolysaccharide biosynthesis WecB/TagA/CpsF family protein